ncbi:MAG TPA: hypothetical protein VFV31_14710 [Chitinophagaceae bacterium]|nr:hypothetical protein [Chitinophagaceae bacterium]
MDNSLQNMPEKLVDYLDGKLEGAEKSELEQQLANDKSLQEQWENLIATREALQQAGLKHKVAVLHNQMMEERKVPVRQISSTRRILRYSIAIAASLVLLVAGYAGYQFYTLSSEKVYAANFQPYELNTLRDGAAAENEIEALYRQKKYKEVVALSYTRPYAIKENFIRGLSYAETADNSGAISCFLKVINDNKAAGSSVFKDESEYYLALSYIRNKDYDFALDILKSISSNPEHLYNKKVNQKLIRQVKMLKWR